MHNQPTDAIVDYGDPMSLLPGPQHPVELAPIDQHILQLTGDLPNLPLLINPALLDSLRSSSPSVHTIETSGRKLPGSVARPNGTLSGRDLPDPDDHQDMSYRAYLLKPRIESYTRALEIYAHLDGSFTGKFSLRLQACRKFAWFVQSSITKKLRVQSSRCKLRWCPICRDVSRMIVTKAVNEWLEAQKYPKMITLTLKHNDDELIVQINHLYKSFQNLRKRAYFQRLISGGVWFFQLKFNQKSQQWHPHIHCLVAGKFLPHARLKALWFKITGDSNVVDIRPVKDVESCSNEVARYATSPADITAVDFDRALTIFYATKHRRICGSWGSARSVTLKPTPLEDTGEWSKVADFYFINCKKKFDPQVLAFWQCFKRGVPYEGPQLQKLTEVFQEDFLAYDSTCEEQLTVNRFMALVTKGRDHGWKDFYGPLYKWADSDEKNL